MAKYSKELVEKIVRLIEEDVYTVTDICRLLHISRKTFYTWNESKPGFAEAVETVIQT